MKISALILIVILLGACSLSDAPTPAPVIRATGFPTQVLLPTPSPTLVPLSNELPGPVIPTGFGVNIHFVRTSDRELDLLAEAGVKFVRMDFVWESVEPARGVYYFEEYESLVASLRQRGIRILFILDYANPLYDDGLAPYTADGRAAFARFAAAAAEHFAGNGILWEIWNEPNHSQFWKPEPNPADYAALAGTTIQAIRAADPAALIVGPAVCCFGDPRGWEFLEQLGRSGVLRQFDAITIHPYTDQAPETVEELYEQVGALVEKYSPQKRLPLYSGEWGYSTAWADLNETRQAEYLVRSWLVNLSSDVHLSIWYDWKNDCPDPGNAECNFGLVDDSLHPKIPYLAAKTLMHMLDGYSFERRLPAGNQDDYLLLFKHGDQSIIAAWTIAEEHSITLSFPGESLPVLSMLGDAARLSANNDRVNLTLTGSPQYLMLGSQKIP